jgi:ribulose-phosphate 3-epimerase
MKYILAPSILSANFSHLGESITIIENSAAEWIHIDIMDGVFVPNISFGLPVVRDIRPLSKKIFDVHLMIINPDNYIDSFKSVGADVLTVHYEACTHLHRSIQKVKSSGMKIGVALNPHTPVSVLEDVISELDLVLLMSVNPGFGGQSFITNTFEKIKKLKTLILKSNSNALIEIDGGVSMSNKSLLLECGADILVAGNSLFQNDNLAENIKLFKN